MIQVKVKIEPLDRSDERKGRPSVFIDAEWTAKTPKQKKKQMIKTQKTLLHDPRTIIHTNTHILAKIHEFKKLAPWNLSLARTKEEIEKVRKKRR